MVGGLAAVPDEPVGDLPLLGLGDTAGKSALGMGGANLFPQHGMDLFVGGRLGDDEGGPGWVDVDPPAGDTGDDVGFYGVVAGVDGDLGVVAERVHDGDPL
ncbi:hypothetical protein [Phytoactinopolyspora limicola]|uniref:hypothetical protein n=1 Tax=Phytoactinopolyspora limicola TaxID=2715536 RepID=UPI00140ABC16|nr:hypothetical protein [Phytoactinopolyspora limicola]